MSDTLVGEGIMALFFIAYDLDKPGQNYDAVHALLNSWKAQRVLESTWAMKSDLSADQIKKAMRSPRGPVDTNDRLLVVEETDWSYYNLMFDLDDL
jgi:hypothetical protein